MFTLVQPYKMSSISSRKIAEALGVKRIFVTKNTYVPKESHVVINWGSHKIYPNVVYVNHPKNVSIAANKLSSFCEFKEHGVPTVGWTTSKKEAKKAQDSGVTVLARTLLNASEGKGIVVCEPGTPLPDAPLYTFYKKKKKEFRVHVCDGEAIDVQQKRKRKEYTGKTNPWVRSYRYGWVFCRKDIEEPAELRSVAVAAVKALNLDFGAVDVIWNANEDKCYVLEVNTAPGIEGSSTEIYKKALTAYLQKLQNAPTTKKSLKNTFVI